MHYRTLILAFALIVCTGFGSLMIGRGTPPPARLSYLVDCDDNPGGTDCATETGISQGNNGCDCDAATIDIAESCYEPERALRASWASESTQDYQIRWAFQLDTISTYGSDGNYVFKVVDTVDTSAWLHWDDSEDRLDIGCAGGVGETEIPTTIADDTTYYITIDYDTSAGDWYACIKTTAHDGTDCASNSATCDGTDTDVEIIGMQAELDVGGTFFDTVEGGAWAYAH